MFVNTSECAERSTAVDFLSICLSHTAVVLKLLAIKLHDLHKIIAFHNKYLSEVYEESTSSSC